jgi:hypothetical protein
LADTLKAGQGRRARAFRIAQRKQAFEADETPNRSQVFLAFVHSSPGIRSSSFFIILLRDVATAWQALAQSCGVRPLVGIGSRKPVSAAYLVIPVPRRFDHPPP